MKKKKFVYFFVCLSSFNFWCKRKTYLMLNVGRKSINLEIKIGKKRMTQHDSCNGIELTEENCVQQAMQALCPICMKLFINYQQSFGLKLNILSLSTYNKPSQTGVEER